jgi:AraC-like DNA-binding protein
MLDTTQSDYAAAQLPRKAMVEELVPFVSANAWIKAAMHCRFNIDPLFNAAGVSLSAHNLSMIRKSAMLDLMRQCVDLAAPDFYFPLLKGEFFAFDHLPALETFLATSPTLRHALPALQWAGMTIPGLSLCVEESGDETALIVDVDVPDSEGDVRAYFVDAIFAAIARIVRLALGPTDLVHRVETRHQPNEQMMRLAATFLAPIQPGQKRDAAVFATRMLDMPLPGASPGLHLRAQELIKQQLPDNPEDLVGVLERTFRQSPALLGQGLDRMAQRLGRHPRTLQRHLREQGQQFTDIQARCRLEMAKSSLVGAQCDIESLSAELGFADRHSFTRAFKRWTGLSPSAYRRQEQTGRTGHTQ